MKWSLSGPLTTMFVLCPAMLLAQPGSGGNSNQQPQVQRSGAEVTQVTVPSTTDQTLEQIRQSQRNHFRTCDQSLDQARNKAHTLAREANGQSYNVDAIQRQHQQLQEHFRTLKENRDRLLEGLSPEQQNSIQERSQSMRQIHERIDNRLQEIDQQFSGSVLNLTKVAEHARAVERETKLYQKHLQATGRTLNLLND